MLCAKILQVKAIKFSAIEILQISVLAAGRWKTGKISMAW